MTKKERFNNCIQYFSSRFPNAETELTFDNAYELLVAVILSAQCTDKRVNLTTPELFRKYPDVYALNKATYDDLFEIIRSISFPGNKTRHLLGMSKMVVENYAGNIPMLVEELIKLPGVGRKTANVITSVIDNQPNLAVDTHVFRVSARIGLTTRAKNPLETEKQLLKHIPTHLVHKFHHWLILHGRYTCIARRPKCEECGLKSSCKYFLKLNPPLSSNFSVNL